jgi:hypothetical protein
MLGVFEERVLRRLSETKSGTVIDEGENGIMRRYVILHECGGLRF